VTLLHRLVRLACGAVPMMMHGFGDNINPYDETIELVDEIVKEFIANMVGL
jgi:hypothetical protein